MTYKQKIEWKEFSVEKPKNNDWVVFFIKTKMKVEEEEKDDITVFFGQFKHPFEQEPDVYKEGWQYFAIPNNKTVMPDEITEWTSLTDMASKARLHFVEKCLKED